MLLFKSNESMLWLYGSDIQSSNSNVISDFVTFNLTVCHSLLVMLDIGAVSLLGLL